MAEHGHGLYLLLSHATDPDTLWELVSLTHNPTCLGRPDAPDGGPDYHTPCHWLGRT